MTMPMHSAVVVSVMVLLSALNLGATSDLRLVEAVKRQETTTIRLLLKQRVEVDAKLGDGSTALHWAIQHDDGETIDLLLRAGADVNAADDLGTTPLALACLNRNAAVVEKLLARKANPNAASVTGASPLMIASRTGAVGAAKALIVRGANVNAKESSRGQTALMWAAAQRHPDVVRLLIEAGAEIGARTLNYPQPVSFGPERPTPDPAAFGIIQKGGSTPLLFAARSGDVKSAALLLDAGASVNEALPDGQSALILAIRSGHELLARFLVERGADPNAIGTGYAPLHVAVLHNQPELVKALLAHGANPNLPLTNGTPIRRNSGDLEIAVGQGVSVPMNLLGATPLFLAARYADVNLMRILLAASGDPRMRTTNEVTPLIAAAGLGWGERITRRGVDYPASVLATDGSKSTILKSREEQETLEAVRLLLEQGVDVNQRDFDGNTPLFGAATEGFDSVVRLLVEKGADVNVTNKRGLTPLSITQGKGAKSKKTTTELTSTAELLRELGAKE